MNKIIIFYIGAGAFSSCENLEKVNMPESLETIGQSAFQGCESLSSVVLPKDLTEIKEQTFSGCDNLKREKGHNSNPGNCWK
ncbi:MAG: leucine-rich repeat domain-containing protein [Clostridium sp.]|nr:leucine-rich repeat domain-containing protein [Clostridium sp.]